MSAVSIQNYHVITNTRYFCIKTSLLLVTVSTFGRKQDAICSLWRRKRCLYSNSEIRWTWMLCIWKDTTVGCLTAWFLNLPKWVRIIKLLSGRGRVWSRMQNCVWQAGVWHSRGTARNLYRRDLTLFLFVLQICPYCFLTMLRDRNGLYVK